MKNEIKIKLKHYAFILLVVVVYFLAFFYSVFFTMETLIKGEELNAPDFVGKSFTESQKIAEEKNVHLKKIIGTYDRQSKPNVVINQVPSPGVRIKENSIIKVFVPSNVIEVIVPNVVGLHLNESERVLRESDLIKRYISYVDSGDIPVDVIVGQSFPFGSRMPRGSEMDLLVSRGPKEITYMMPDFIGKKGTDVVTTLEQLGLKVTPPTRVSYPGVEPGTVIKQYPLSGFPINTKARITIEVSR